MFEGFEDDECPDCGRYTKSGSWCNQCLDEKDLDLDESEERKRNWLQENQEY